MTDSNNPEGTGKVKVECRVTTGTPLAMLGRCVRAATLMKQTLASAARLKARPSEGSGRAPRKGKGFDPVCSL